MKIDQLNRIKNLSILTAIVLGLLHAWFSRFEMTADGMSYLDIADNYLKGDFKATVCPSWSPLYPFLVSIAFYLFKPSSYWEFSLVHLVNFIIYLFTIFSFNFFICELLNHNKNQASKISKEGLITLPDWAILIIGYSLFIYSSLHIIALWGPDPDMLFSTFVYLASGISLKIYRGQLNSRNFLLLGIVFAFGYLAKTPMFVLAFVYLILVFFAAVKYENLTSSVLKVVLAFITFILISSPYIYAISQNKGYLTFGESGKLNYAWYINDIVPFTHWQGEPKDFQFQSGKPKHPTRKIYDNPPVYEFGSPIPGTYPPFYDPTYWYEGITPRFDLFRQICAICASTFVFNKIFIKLLGFLIPCFAILFFMGNRKELIIKDILGEWILLVPALSAFCMFSLVHLEPRYIGAYIVIFYLTLLCSIRMSGEKSEKESKRLIEVVVFIMTLMLMITIGTTTSNELSLWQTKGSVHNEWNIASSLKQMGLKEKDKVATIGYGVPYLAYWARLLKVTIVAEVTTDDADKFWALNESKKLNIIHIFSKMGIKAIVAKKIPLCCLKNSWKKINNSDSYIYLLNIPL